MWLGGRTREGPEDPRAGCYTGVTLPPSKENSMLGDTLPGARYIGLRLHEDCSEQTAALIVIAEAVDRLSEEVKELHNSIAGHLAE